MCSGPSGAGVRDLNASRVVRTCALTQQSWATNPSWHCWVPSLLSGAYPSWGPACFLHKGDTSATARRLFPVQPSENTTDTGSGRSYLCSTDKSGERAGVQKGNEWDKALCPRLCMTPRGTFQLLRVRLCSSRGSRQSPVQPGYVLHPGALVADTGSFKGCLWVGFSNKPGHTCSPGAGTNKHFINPPPQPLVTTAQSMRGCAKEIWLM